MRITTAYCHKRNCLNTVRSGFRFCRLPNCGKKDNGDEEE